MAQAAKDEAAATAAQAAKDEAAAMATQAATEAGTSAEQHDTVTDAEPGKPATKTPPTSLDADSESHPAAAHSAAIAVLANQFVCCQCRKDLTEVDKDYVSVKANTFRCGRCNRMNNRISNLRKAGSIQDGWDQMDRDARIQFYKENHTLTGTELAMQIIATIANSSTDTLKNTFSKSAEDLDEEDLEETFRKKPLQLRNILATAKVIICKVRGVKLYEVPKYKYEEQQEQSKGYSRRLEFSSDDKLASDKKRRKDGPTDVVVKVQKWNAKQLTRADSLLKSMIMVSEQGATALVENGPLPQSLAQKVQLAMANLDAEKQTGSLALTAHGSTNKFIDVINAAADILTTAEATLTAIDAYNEAIA